MPEHYEESLSSRALAAFVKEHGAGYITDRTQIHRTQLWRYATGRGKPDAEQVAKLYRATDGAVAADGWETVKVELSEPEAEDSEGDDSSGGTAPAAE